MMLDFTTLRQVIEEYLRANFTTCAVKYENVPLKNDDIAEWIAVFDKPTFAQSTGLGESSALTGGVLIIQIFTPIGTGTARSREIAKELATLFGGQDLTGYSMLTPELHSMPDSSSWYQINLQIPYIAIMGQELTC